MAGKTAVKEAATETLEQKIARLEAENAQLKEQTGTSDRLSLKVSGKGAISAYGLGRFPATYYQEQWLKILDNADAIRQFIADNKDKLKTK